MSAGIERVEIDGEQRRRFFLVAEVTFADEGEDNYFMDSELVSLAQDRMAMEFQYLEDRPAVKFRPLDAYAHELAEKIRNAPSPRDPDDYGALVDAGADWAADLIDPEVLDSGE